MSNQPVIKGLYAVLADTYALTIKTHNYHWNVEGPGFASLHQLFETQYNELFEATDVLAERMRALDSKVNGGLAAFAKASSIADGDTNLTAEQMIEDLHDGHQRVLAAIKKAADAAEKAKADASADLLTERRAAHEKAAWMLKSCLPKTQRLKQAA